MSLQSLFVIQERVGELLVTGLGVTGYGLRAGRLFLPVSSIRTLLLGLGLSVRVRVRVGVVGLLMSNLMFALHQCVQGVLCVTVEEVLTTWLLHTRLPRIPSSGSLSLSHFKISILILILIICTSHLELSGRSEWL